MLYRHELRAGRRQILAGQAFERGTVVPDEILSKIPPNRVASMKRVGLLLETVTPAEDAVFADVVVEEDVEGLCPQCGEGPFSRLARHVAAKHESIEELESVNGVS